MIVKTAYTYDDIQIVPSLSEVESRSHCSLYTNFTENVPITIPLISAPMDTVTEVAMAYTLGVHGAVGIIHRFDSIEEQVKKTEMVHQQLALFSDVIRPTAAAVGVVGDYLERAQALVYAGANVILIDVAHGHTELMRKALRELKNSLPERVDIIAGNVSTGAGATALAEWGASAIRVGIGGGSLCETRIRTGVGVPQATAVSDCVASLTYSGYGHIPVIADGGIRTPGDVAKALALGASSVMIGSIFAGTEETPGEVIKIGHWPNEKRMKKYRGSASMDAKIASGKHTTHVEGNSVMIPVKGSVMELVDDICDGVKSAMSYVGATTLKDFMLHAEFVHVTSNGVIEAHPHLMLK